VTVIQAGQFYTMIMAKLHSSFTQKRIDDIYCVLNSQSNDLQQFKKKKKNTHQTYAFGMRDPGSNPL